MENISKSQKSKNVLEYNKFLIEKQRIDLLLSTHKTDKAIQLFLTTLDRLADDELREFIHYYQNNLCFKQHDVPIYIEPFQLRREPVFMMSKL